MKHNLSDQQREMRARLMRDNREAGRVRKRGEEILIHTQKVMRERLAAATLVHMRGWSAEQVAWKFGLPLAPTKRWLRQGCPLCVISPWEILGCE